ncbi:MAG: hypothetical protein EOO40_02135, partial [Deltaproteobacteria bacterium]
MSPINNDAALTGRAMVASQQPSFVEHRGHVARIAQLLGVMPVDVRAVRGQVQAIMQRLSSHAERQAAAIELLEAIDARESLPQLSASNEQLRDRFVGGSYVLARLLREVLYPDRVVGAGAPVGGPMVPQARPDAASAQAGPSRGLASLQRLLYDPVRGAPFEHAVVWSASEATNSAQVCNHDSVPDNALYAYACPLIGHLHDVYSAHLRAGAPLLAPLRALLTCPITEALFVDPVTDADGNTFEREAIELTREQQPESGTAAALPPLFANTVVRGIVELLQTGQLSDAPPQDLRMQRGGPPAAQALARPQGVALSARERVQQTFGQQVRIGPSASLPAQQANALPPHLLAPPRAGQ